MKNTLIYIAFVILSFSPSLLLGQKFGFERADTIQVIENSTLLNSPWAGGINTAQISKIHLNDDLLEDLFVFDRTGDKVLTYINDGTNYIYQPQYESSFPNLYNWALLRDYNCDGKKDIFSYVSGGIGIWKNISVTDTVKFEFISDPYVYSLQYGNLINLFVSKTDIPDFNDIDGDGDLDVLTFGIIGSRIEYHRNYSVENGHGCDSLQFELKNACWGHFVESGLGTNTPTMFDTCTNNVSAPEKGTDGGPKHSGSTVLSLDLNNDNVRDLVLGDVSFNNLVALTNDNGSVNSNTSMVAMDTLFPNNTISVDLQIFPASFYEDIDNDGVKDLIVSPNIDKESENYESILYYQNLGTDSQPNFLYSKNNLLQDEMIEMGQSAYPVLFDYNNDGLTDLLVANFGYFDKSAPDNYRSQIAYYENIGSSTNPKFELITRDFQNLYAIGMDKAIYPTFADLDNDGDTDAIIGDYSGHLHYFDNTSGSLSSMNLLLTSPQMPDIAGSAIDVGYTAKPFLFDIDNDNDFDLIIGEGNGNLNYYNNIGTASSPQFLLVSDNFGDIDVSEWFTNIGSSSPILFKNSDNETQLFVGTERGAIFHYNNIDGNLTGAFTEVDTLVANINIGPNSVISIAELNNDGELDLIVGNKRGGLGFYWGNENFVSFVIENEQYKTKLYPNPSSGIINIEHNYREGKIKIYNSMGQLLKNSSLTKLVDLTKYEGGIYFIIIESFQNRETYKVIKK